MAGERLDILRLGYRRGRDPRITTHLALVGRALGADRFLLAGDDVAKMQKALGIAADGDFGFGTQTALKKWQKLNGLTADGIAGPATQAKLFG